jgi:CRP-like cAMP-binding protein
VPIDERAMLGRLAGMPLFDGLDDDELDFLAVTMDEIEVGAGAAVVKQGQMSPGLFVLDAGTALVRTEDAYGRGVRIAELGRGDVFGEMSLLHGEPCVATVTATTNLRLLRLGRDPYLRFLGERSGLRGRLEETSSRRATQTLASLTRPADPASDRFDQLLRRLIEREMDAMRADDVRGEHGTFDEVMAFYGSTRFLYPEKMGFLATRVEAVRETWARLTDADGSVFKMLMLRHVRDGQLVVKNSICAFEHSPGTWQVQHLVSSQRHEYAGTLASVLGIIDWLGANAEAQCIRLSYRPDNPGTAPLFEGVAAQIPPDTRLVSTCDYHLAPLVDVPRPAVAETELEVRTARPDETDSVATLYAQRHPRLASWLAVDRPSLPDLAARYDDRRLERGRTLLVAVLDGAVVGTVSCWWSSEGINLSFLENAVEELHVATHLDLDRQVEVVGRLLATAAETYRSRGRAYMVALLDERHRDLVIAADVLPRSTKQYAVVSVDRTASAFAQPKAVIENYYSRLLRTQPLADEG